MALLQLQCTLICSNLNHRIICFYCQVSCKDMVHAQVCVVVQCVFDLTFNK